jgi:hypothetical protein
MLKNQTVLAGKINSMIECTLMTLEVGNDYE